MRIQHNIMAMNAYRNYTNNTSALSKNLEKLSSGYKINRAGDDAAGLAISEKMRAQITGLKTAQKNAKDGISLVQTAEGALTEVHDMLNRMVELAEQSSNGTYDDTVDRNNLQKEFNALRTEIDRIASSSNFNGIKLLDGSLNGSGGALSQELALSGVATQKQAVTAATGSFSVDLDGLSGKNASTGDIQVAFTIDIGGKKVSANITISGGGSLTAGGIANAFDGKTIQIDNITYTIDASGTTLTFETNTLPTTDAQTQIGKGVTITNSASGDTSVSGTYNPATQIISTPKKEQAGQQASASFTLTADMVKDGNSIKIGDTTYTFKVGKDSTVAGGNVIDLSSYEADTTNLVDLAGEKLTDAASGNADFTVGYNRADDKVTIQQKTTSTKDLSTADKVKAEFSWANGAASALELQIGEDNNGYNKLSVSVQDMHVKSLGIDASAINIDTQTNAQTAIGALKAAINTVSGVRGDLGATQNRLEHTINNLAVMQENIQDAEATIRDVDVAEEMMAYTKNNILVQSAQAMLAQANQVPQGVLQLLQ